MIVVALAATFIRTELKPEWGLSSKVPTRGITEGTLDCAHNPNEHPSSSTGQDWGSCCNEGR